MNKETITLCGNDISIEGGLMKAGAFYEEAGVTPKEKWLYLDRDGDIDIPLLPDDHIIIHGGEKIFSGEPNPQIGENPTVRNPIILTFNDKKIEQGLIKAKITGGELQQLDKDLNTKKLFADLSGAVDAFVTDNTTLVLQDADCYFTIPAGDDDAIDLEECAKHGRKPPKKQPLYKIKIDGDTYKNPKSKMTGESILNLVGKTYEEWTLNRKYHGGRRKSIEQHEEIDFSEPGVERFETVRIQAQQG